MDGAPDEDDDDVEEAENDQTQQQADTQLVRPTARVRTTRNGRPAAWRTALELSSTSVHRLRTSLRRVAARWRTDPQGSSVGGGNAILPTLSSFQHGNMLSKHGGQPVLAEGSTTDIDIKER